MAASTCPWAVSLKVTYLFPAKMHCSLALCQHSEITRLNRQLCSPSSACGASIRRKHFSLRLCHSCPRMLLKEQRGWTGKGDCSWQRGMETLHSFWPCYPVTASLLPSLTSSSPDVKPICSTASTSHFQILVLP